MIYPRTMASSGTTFAFFTNMTRPSSCSLSGLISCGISSMSAVTKWVGITWPSFLNQKSEILVRILPFSGTP